MARFAIVCVALVVIACVQAAPGGYSGSGGSGGGGGSGHGGGQGGGYGSGGGGGNGGGSGGGHGGGLSASHGSGGGGGGGSGGSSGGKRGGYCRSDSDDAPPSPPRQRVNNHRGLGRSRARLTLRAPRHVSCLIVAACTITPGVWIS
ncbi:unnamed protein product, partial [Brenthis ino]